MKRISSLLVIISLCPFQVFAQDFKETIYVVSQVNRTELPLESCNWALPLLGGQPLISAARSELYSVSNKHKKGFIKNPKRQVGTLEGCTAEGTLEYERVDFPTADLGEIWRLTLHGEQYTVTGSNRFRTNPFDYPNGFPVPNTGMFLGTGTGTVHKPFATHWPPVVVGSFSTNYVLSSSPADGIRQDLSSIITIRLYEYVGEVVST